MFIIPALKVPLFHYSSPENLIIPLFPKNQGHYSIIPVQKISLFRVHYSSSPPEVYNKLKTEAETETYNTRRYNIDTADEFTDFEDSLLNRQSMKFRQTAEIVKGTDPERE